MHLWNLEWAKHSGFKSFKIQGSFSFDFALSTASNECIFMSVQKSSLNVVFSNNVLFFLHEFGGGNRNLNYIYQNTCFLLLGKEYEEIYLLQYISS